MTTNSNDKFSSKEKKQDSLKNVGSAFETNNFNIVFPCRNIISSFHKKPSKLEKFHLKFYNYFTYRILTFFVICHSQDLWSFIKIGSNYRTIWPQQSSFLYKIENIFNSKMACPPLQINSYGKFCKWKFFWETLILFEFALLHYNNCFYLQASEIIHVEGIKSLLDQQLVVLALFVEFHTQEIYLRHHLFN